MIDASQITILIADDEPDVIEILSYNLHKEGYRVVQAADGREALRMAQEVLPQLILLDVMMPYMNGVEVCRNLRRCKELNHSLIVFLTARSDDKTEIESLQAGADDYITKPIRPKVLLARIKALLARHSLYVHTSSATIREFANLTIDVENHKAVWNTHVLALPNKEFALLCLLTSEPEKVFTREEIYTHIWGKSVVVGDRTIDVYIRKLRAKLHDEYIETIKGVGYTFLKR